MNETIRERIRKISAYAVNFPLETVLEITREECVTEALRVAKGNVTLAADLLGIHRNTLHGYIRRMR